MLQCMLGIYDTDTDRIPRLAPEVNEFPKEFLLIGINHIREKLVVQLNSCLITFGKFPRKLDHDEL